MAYDVPKSAGKEAQLKEFYISEILRVQPERANDSNLYYGDVELEYLRLVNDGIIAPNIPDRLSDANVKTTIRSLALPRWEPNTAYTVGQIVVHPNGDVKVVKNDHTSSSTTGVANWQDPPAFATEITQRKRDLARVRRDIARENPRISKKVSLPSALGWNPPIPIFFNGSEYYTTYDVATLKNTGGTTRYVNTATGLNTNTGLTEDSPYLSLNQAVSVAADGDEIVILNKGVSFRNQVIMNANAAITKSLNIVARYPGETYFSSADNLTYTQNATYSNVYQSARSNVGYVVDISIDPEGFRYSKTNTLAECAELPGSWYTDGTTIFVHSIDGKIPDNQKVLALLTVNLFHWDGSARASSHKIYLEGINVIGGNEGTSILNTSANRTTFAAKNCKFLWNLYISKDVFYTLGNVDSYVQNCTAALSGKDGFNYHAQGGYIPKFVEIDCHGHSNGLYGASTDYSMNASTAHDGAVGIRIGGKYHHSKGVPVADVHTGTKVAMYSCDMWDSQAPIDSGYNAAYSAQQSGVEAWLYSCRMWGTQYDLYCVTGTTVHITDTEYDTSIGGGTFDIISAV